MQGFVSCYTYGLFHPEDVRHDRISVEGLTPVNDFVRALRLDPQAVSVADGNGNELDLSASVPPDTDLHIHVAPGEVMTILLIISIVISIASIALGFIMKPSVAAAGDSEQTQEARLIQGTRNEARLFEQIPLTYGESVRLVPPLGTNFRTDPSNEVDPITKRPRDGMVSGSVVWGPADHTDPTDVVVSGVQIGETPFESFNNATIAYTITSGTGLIGIENVIPEAPGANFSIHIANRELLSNNTWGLARVPWVYVDKALRSATDGALKLQLDILFPQGLKRVSPPEGNTHDRSVVVMYRLKRHDVENFPVPDTSVLPGNQSPWQNPTGAVPGFPPPSQTAPSTWYGRTFTGRSLQPRYESITIDLQDPLVRSVWELGDATQVDVEMIGGPVPLTQPQRSFTTEQGGNGDDALVSTGEFQWISLKSFLPGVAIRAKNVAVSTFQLKATDQLNGTPDSISGLVSRKVPTLIYDGPNVVLGPRAYSSNPALIVLDILTNPIVNKLAISPTRLDLEAFKDWEEWCNEKGLTFRGVLEGKKVFEAVQAVARAGRAYVNLLAPRIYPIIKRPVETPTRILTARNARVVAGREFSSQLELHAIRIPFRNAEDDRFYPDEAHVYFPGYDEETAENWETLESPLGVTDPDQVRRIAILESVVERHHRAEKFAITLPAEGLLLRAGDAIRLAHSRLGIGFMSARVSNVAVSGSNVTGFSIDAPLILDNFEPNPVADNGLLSFELAPLVATTPHYDFTLADPAPEDSIRLGEIVSLGAGTRASVDLLIESWELRSPFLVQLSAVPLANDALVAVDEDELPPWEPLTTPLPPMGGRSPAAPIIHLATAGFSEDDGSPVTRVAWSIGDSSSGQFAPTNAFRVRVEYRNIEGPLPLSNSQLLNADVSVVEVPRPLDATEATVTVYAWHVWEGRPTYATTSVEISLIQGELGAPTNLRWEVDESGDLFFRWDAGNTVSSAYVGRWKLGAGPWTNFYTLGEELEIPEAKSGNYVLELYSTTFTRASEKVTLTDNVNVFYTLGLDPPSGLAVEGMKAPGLWDGTDLVLVCRPNSVQARHSEDGDFNGLPIPDLARYRWRFTAADAGVTFEDKTIVTVEPRITLTGYQNILFRLRAGITPVPGRDWIVDVRAEDIHGRVSEWTRARFDQPNESVPNDLISVDGESSGGNLNARVKILATPQRGLSQRLHRVAVWKRTTAGAVLNASDNQNPDHVFYQNLVQDGFAGWVDLLVNEGLLIPTANGASSWWIRLGFGDELGGSWERSDPFQVS